MLSITAARERSSCRSLSQLPLRPGRLWDGLVVYSYGGIVAMMRGHMGKAVEDVDRIGVVYHLHAFAHIPYRHAVVVLVQRDVTVALDRGNRPLSHLDSGPGAKASDCLSRWSQTADGGIPLRRVRLRALNFSKDSRIATLKRLQVMEHHSLQIDIHRTVHQLDCVFHQCLVPGMPHTGRGPRRIRNARQRLRSPD